MMWWAIWCAAVVAGGAGAAAAPAPASEAFAPIDLVQMDPPAPDDEGVSYAMPSTGGRFGSGSPWLYLFAEMPRDSQVPSSAGIAKRQTISVNPAVDHLIQRFRMEQLRQDNRNYIDRVGKRGAVRVLRQMN